jgi:predicted CoA-binding protein
MQKTLVIGASSNPIQYSHLAIQKLMAAGHPVEAIGREAFEIGTTKVVSEKIDFKDIHTITLYLNKERQKEYADYIIALNPKRIIFNPGAENPELFNRTSILGIEAIEACTLVMLAAGTY